MEQMPVSDEERTWAMLAHLLTLVGYVVWIGAYLVPLVIYLVYKDKSPFVAFHALQSLFFQLALLVVVAILLLLSLTVVFGLCDHPCFRRLGHRGANLCHRRRHPCLQRRTV